MADILNTVEYNFKEFTDKDMFGVKLKGTIPDFGYMSCSNRSKFFGFCVNMGFIEFAGTASQKKRYAYRILVAFKYRAMGNYRPVDVNCNPGEMIVVDNLYIPRDLLLGCSTKINGKWRMTRAPTLSDIENDA